MPGLRIVLLLLALGAALSAQVSWTSSQVVDFVRKSAKSSQDKEVAEYLKKVTLTDRLSDDRLESCIQAGIGPRKRAALFVLLEQSSALPETRKSAAQGGTIAKPSGPPPPSEEEKAQVLEKVTEYARGYIQNLPNFTCTQVTRRYVDPSATGKYQLDDTIVENLSYSDKHESYKVVSVNNTPTSKSHWDLGGVTSAGEFGTDMAVLFDRQTRTEFIWDSWTTWGGRRTHRIAYRVLQENSRWTIDADKTQRIVPGYKGFVYVDREFNMIMRITSDAVDVPVDFPIQNVKQDTRYGFKKIGEREQEFLVPTESVITSKTGRSLKKNETQFTLYRKFGTESVIKFETGDEVKK